MPEDSSKNQQEFAPPPTPRFATVRRGLDPSQVGTHLQALGDAMRRLGSESNALRSRIRELEEAVANPHLDLDTVTETFGRQASEILRGAHDAAASVRAQAETSAKDLLARAKREAVEVESQAQITADAQINEAAESSREIIEGSRLQAQEIIAMAEQGAASIVQRAKAEGRSLLHRAREMRSKILAETQSKVDALSLEIDELETTRRVLQQLIRSADSLIGQANHVLDREDSGHRSDAQSVPDGDEQDTENPDLGSADLTDAAPGDNEGLSESAPSEADGVIIAPIEVAAAGVSVASDDSYKDAGDAIAVVSPPAQGVAKAHVEHRYVDRRSTLGRVESPSSATPISPRELDEISDHHGFEESSWRIIGVVPAELEPVAQDPQEGSPGPIEVEAQEPGQTLAEEPEASSTNHEIAAVDQQDEADLEVTEAPLETSVDAPLEAVTTAPPYQDRLSKLEDLFERLRSSKDETAAVEAPPEPESEAVEHAIENEDADVREEQVDAVAAVAAVSETEHPDGDEEIHPEPPPRPASSPAQSSLARALSDPMTRERVAKELLEKRSRALQSVEVGLSRRLKRILQDHQNEILASLREGGLDKAVERASQLSSGGVDEKASTTPLLLEAARKGIEFALHLGEERPDMQDPPPSATLVDEVGRLSVGLLDTLETLSVGRVANLSGSLIQGDEPSQVSLIGSVFRDIRSSKVEELVGDFVSSAFAYGVRDQSEAVGFMWVTDDLGGNCPDCDDNALANVNPKDEEFPTGQYVPPVHAGCRCLIVPVFA